MAIAKKQHKKNVRRKSPNKRRAPASPPPVVRRLRQGVVVTVVLTMVGLGVWQCVWPDEQNGARNKGGMRSVSEVDVGAGDTADPTIVNEQLLLKREMEKGAGAKGELISADVEVPREAPSIEAAGDSSKGADVDDAPDSEPTDPLDVQFPLYGVAYHFYTQVMATPDPDGVVIASIRRGATFRVSERVSQKGCKRGWHQIRGGGYVCDGKGVMVKREPVTWPDAPPPAKVMAAMPYDYRYTRKNDVIEYWKLPSADEVAAAEVVQARRKAAATPSSGTGDGAAVGATSKSPDTGGGDGIGTDDKAALQAVLSRAAALSSGTDTDSSVLSPKIAQSTAAPAVAMVDSDAPDPNAWPPYVHMNMQKGYFVSVAGQVESGGVSYFKTVRGRYVRADALYPAVPSNFSGVLLGEKWRLPVAFVINGGARTLKQSVADGPLKSADKVARLSAFQVTGEITRGRRTYYRIGDGRLLNERVVAVAAVATRWPDDLEDDERWIDVNLSSQTLVAYQGRTPVFATIVSTGKPGFETPEGEFHIYNKNISITMDDPEGGDEAYSIEDVPWTQYFKEGYALHTAFWHDRFGRVRSHGCVNLSAADAHRLFFWTGPHLPDGVHAIVATRENPGTRVVVHH